jgi:hypothetical protein
MNTQPFQLEVFLCPGCYVFVFVLCSARLSDNSVDAFWASQFLMLRRTILDELPTNYADLFVVCFLLLSITSVSELFSKAMNTRQNIDWKRLFLYVADTAPAFFCIFKSDIPSGLDLCACFTIGTACLAISHDLNADSTKPLLFVILAIILGKFSILYLGKFSVKESLDRFQTLAYLVNYGFPSMLSPWTMTGWTLLTQPKRRPLLQFIAFSFAAVFLCMSPKEILHANHDARNVTTQVLLDLALIVPLIQLPLSDTRSTLLTYLMAGIPIEAWFDPLNALLK